MKKLLLSLLHIVVIGSVQAQTIETFAGNGTNGSTGDGGTAKLAALGMPYGVAKDKDGNVYISDYGYWVIRKVTPLGIISTIAGTPGVGGPEGDGGPASAGKLFRPLGIAVDSAYNIFICDHGHNKIRKINKGGIITTVAGTGSAGFNNDGILATSATINNPADVAVDIVGNIYIADQANYRVRKVSTSGIISTIAGTGVSGFSGDGGPATNAQISNPYSVDVDTKGNVYIADYSNFRIRKIDTAGIITTIAGTGASGFSGDGGLATIAQMSQPSSVSVDSKGNVFFSDMNNQRVRKIDALGIITTVAGNGNPFNTGDGGSALLAGLNNPAGIHVDSAGVIYVGLSGYKVRAICPSLCPFNIGVNDVQTQDGFNFFPNPTRRVITLISTSRNESIEVYNSVGQKIYSSEKVNYEMEIDLSNQPEGIYFLRVNSENGTVVKKIIKE